MLITRANIDDAQEILALQKLAYQMEAERYNDDTLPPLIQTLAEIQTDFEKMLFLKAVLDDRIVGSVRAAVVDGACLVGRLIVHPDFQNRGIGTKLMQELEGCFQNIKRFELFTGHKTAGALHIYKKLGYREFKQKEMETHTLIFLEKLAPGITEDKQ
ncbi:MAG: GNAT family N-acetyltransferase [Anaerolineae bacterium]|nr:GNAT family N-acetyltransferase [Anaerolineae bacterium]